MNLLNHIKLKLDFNQITSLYQIVEKDPFVYLNCKNNKKEERQGWKIHVSATINNYKKILLLVVQKLVKYQVSFKFLKDKQIFINNINKQTPLQNSGKFITIYPVNIKQFLALLEILYINLKHYQGTIINTDRRYKDSQNVFYRYGVKFAKFAPNFLFHKRKKLLDERSLIQYHPSFIKDPVINNVNPSLTGRFIDYQIKYCLNKNSGGFVFYVLENKTNKSFILINVHKNFLNSPKESLIQRRLAEIQLFYQKHDDLKIPQIVDYFYDSEKNLWLVKEYLEGTTLQLFKNDCAIQLKSSSGKIDFFKIYLIVMRQLVEIINSFHCKDLILNDIKLTNFLIKKDLKVYFIDPEHSYKLSQYISFIHGLNTPYLSKLIVKHRHQNLDYHKLGMMMVDLICGTHLFIKLDDNLNKLFSYLEDIFKYYNFDSKLLNLINQLVFHPEEVNFARYKIQLSRIEDKYQFNQDWVPHFDDDILSKIKQQIIVLNKNYKTNNSWKLKQNTKLTKFADFLIYFDQYDNLTTDEKLLLKQKLKGVKNDIFYCEMLLMILNNIGHKPNSKIQNEFRNKIQNFIDNNLFQSSESFYVKKTPYIKYVEDGSSGLCLILIYGKYYLQVDDFDQLIDAMLSTTKNPFDQKVTLYFGSTGFAFLLLKAYQLWKPNQQYLQDALECFYFLIHQMINHKTIYELNYRKLSVKEIKPIKYVASQLCKYY